MTPRERFVIVLEPLPDRVPAEKRLAHLLKCCLRTFRLKLYDEDLGRLVTFAGARRSHAASLRGAGAVMAGTEHGALVSEPS